MTSGDLGPVSFKEFIHRVSDMSALWVSGTVPVPVDATAGHAYPGYLHCRYWAPVLHRYR